MRRVVFIISLMLLSLPAFAHDEDHCLEHHWSSPIYRTEMQYQLLIIGIGVLSWFAIDTMWRMQRAR